MTIEDERVIGKRRIIKLLEDNIEDSQRLGQMFVNVLGLSEHTTIFYIEDTQLADYLEEAFDAERQTVTPEQALKNLAELKEEIE